MIESPKILVVGDCCMDNYIYCSCERLCPEAPVPVLEIRKKECSWGMAGNVYRNLLDMDVDAKLICNYNYMEIDKTRYVDEVTNHMFVRIDSHSDYPRILASKRREILDGYDAVIISDYDKGFLLADDIEYIAHHHPLTFLDTKKVLGDWANSIRFIKINRKEYAASKGILTSHLESNIIETLGSQGCSYRNKIYPVEKVEVRDMSGAGDTFLAALVKKYLQTDSIEQALEHANEMATIVVQKMGVSTIKD